LEKELTIWGWVGGGRGILVANLCT
jgi:hypothetical protein